ncbi:MAG: GNAT family N-acetyltransferase [Brasilonema octagenarum HA4186-MV1]|jgi:GNAT superfamily N-acetyltransferase|uniref:GNAT family N-acetyltransferase n=2 Tax=Brasilonema TaxID=383614 RepID=A0A856MM80_9CYAN|nr:MULTISPECIES: GNAT family N-acetyltransferase [Brasilonema]MBW4626160.1 GNAT family N-acetyltransferase [Brasilonema octagenarum HA4186-MV1]NMF66522.1 GNAT family N-acetyltransferase [Brasilonema octagenarum UFV-OR1]QDL11204.1 GNAT family N-acetyltransferase [Brasilonema sennae CENA114]QDL17549.1 GNAT family N-acetyltransferase [Brasilonema octagenarum UFV-E1]
MYQIVANLTENQVSNLLDLYKNEFWSYKRQREDIVKMLAASDIIVGLVDENEQLIGFTRVLTDFVYRATVYDVIIKPTHRKMGLGTQLIDAVINHPKLVSVEQITLYCLPEMIPFYQRWDFTGNTSELQLMFRNNA